MIALLDTHALLWSLLEPDKLSPVALAAILSENNTLLVSSASAWELGIKHRLGRLDVTRSSTSTRCRCFGERPLCER